MKLDINTKTGGRMPEDTYDPWQIWTVAPDANQAIELDAYGVYAVEAIDDDIFVREFDASGDVSAGAVDGYGLLIRHGCANSVIVLQRSYDGSHSYVGARSDTISARLRFKKIGRQAP